MAALEGIACKFRGTLVGALLGDCLGAPYEDETRVSKTQLQSYFDKMEEKIDVKLPYKPYTDDIALTRCILKSLIEHKTLDEFDIARRFVKKYYKEPNRGYGMNVVAVFEKLHNTKVADPYGPAKEQFNGQGSYGNGAAMRVSPLPLFFYDNVSELIEATEKISRITHTHRLGIDGAVLQSLAIRKCLLLNPKEKLDTIQFVNELIDEMGKREKANDDPSAKKYSYETQLKAVKDFLLKGNNIYEEEVIVKLGNSFSGIFSVPTAIYTFLRAQRDIPNIITENPFRRTIQYAISLGGDTDTIGSMAGAIAGAYFGHKVINENLQKHCEKFYEIIEFADQLYNIKEKKIA